MISEKQQWELLAQRRADCCADAPKPCPSCDAYWDGMLDLADHAAPHPTSRAIFEDDGIRPGPGGPKTRKTQLSLLPEQYDALAQAGERSGISISAVMRRLISDVLMGD